MLSVDLDRHRGVHGIGQGREQHTAGTGFVVHDQLSGVLDVDVLAERERADPAAHVGDRSEEPLNEIQRMDRLVHQHAAAAASTLAAPRTAGVVLGSAVPGNRGGRAPDRAERPLVDEPVRLLRRTVVPVLEADGDLHGGVREVSVQHRLGVGEGVRDRLLEDDVNSACDAVHRDRRVLVVRCADVHDVGPEGVEHLAMVGVGDRALSVGGGLGAGGVHVTDADELHAVEVAQRRQVDRRDVAAPDDCRADRRRHRFVLRASSSATCCSTSALTSRSSTPSHSSTAATPSRTGP